MTIQHTLKRFLPLFFILFSFQAQAQFTLKFTEPHRLLKQSIEHYEYGHYQKSHDLVQQYLDKNFTKSEREPMGSQDALYEATAEFYKRLTEVGLQKNGGMANLGVFLAETPYAAIQQYGYFKMAKFLFAQQNFIQAIPFYEKSSINYLSNDEITQRNFELAYCYLLNNQLDKVNPLFASIKDVEGDYFSPGNYYHGVLSYYKGEYADALKSFEAVKNQEQYKDIVPFYIAELNYFTGKKDKALKKALSYTHNKDAPYYAAMSQLAGQIYYERKEFTKAEMYLAQFANQNKNVRNDDFFRLGFLQYEKGELENAIEYFQKVKNNGSELYAQSLYYLGLSYLKNGDKKNALLVFKQALKTNQLGKLKEDVKFNTAKLGYDISDAEETEKQLDAFITEFPASKYYQDAVEMLALLNIKSKNFEKASASLRRIGNLSPVFQSVYQKVNYARGIQLLKNGNADLAIPFFTESKKYPVNENLVGLAEFWKTECHYRLGQYQDALSASYSFIDQPGAGNSPALIRNAFLANAYIHMHDNEKEKLKLAYANYLDTAGEISAAQALSQMDSIKPNYVPSHVPFVEANPYVFIYQLPSQNVEFDYKPLPLTPIAYNNTVKGGMANNNYIKVGLGTLRTTHAEVGYDLRDNVGQDLYLTLLHRASKSNNYLQQASINQARLVGTQKLGQFDLSSALQIERTVYRPYGAERQFLTDDSKNRFLDINILSKIKPTFELLKGVKSNATVGFGAYNVKSLGGSWSGTELSFLTDVSMLKDLNEKTSASLGIEIQANKLVGGGKKPEDISTGTSFLLLKPMVSRKVGDINFNIGLFPALAKNITLLPNADASTFLPSLNARVKVGVESELIANSYKQFTQVNPFIKLIDLQQTKRTLYYAGISGAIYSNINYAFKVGGGKVKNLPLYINDTFSNRYFDVLYEKNATILSLQANVEYQLNFNTNAGVQVQYEPLLTMETFTTAFHYVPLQLNAFANYTLMKRLSLRGDLFVRSMTTPFRAASEGSIKKLPGAVDLNVRADYQLRTKWNVFFEVNNVLNNKYNRWNAFPNYGLNVLGGLVYSFNKSLRTSKFITE